MQYGSRMTALQAVPHGVAQGVRYLLWRAAADALRGVRLLPSLAARRARTFYVSFDASSRLGADNKPVCGALGIKLSGGHYLRVELPHAAHDVAWLELFAPVLAVLRYGDLWRGAHIIFGIDSTSVNYMANKLRASREEGLDLLRVFAAALHEFDITHVVRWQPRELLHDCDRVAAAPSDQALLAQRFPWLTAVTTVRLEGKLDVVLARLLEGVALRAMPPGFTFSAAWHA
jgi:hypothetical protein